uniref:uncharacterized protein LOC122601676 n=1 Tax=Erigeron canadensis TaxID=72917 RepID=UPI001CB9AAC2|nr:uncharacterized protein LOC122601676 [Erigeron canadensis]
MGTEVLRPQEYCFGNVAPVIVLKKGDSYRTTVCNNNGYQKPQPQRLLPEKMGSTSGREGKLKLHCENVDDSYAGSAFFHSPSPRSLPLPSFFNKKQESMATGECHDGFDDSATKHLCSLLRLGDTGNTNSINGGVRLHEILRIM